MQRELRDDEDIAADVGERAVHRAGIVVEHAQRGDLAREPARIVVAVVGGDAGEDEQALADRGDRRAVHVDARARNALQHRPHRDGVRSIWVTWPEWKRSVVIVPGSPSAGRYDQRAPLRLSVLPVLMSGGPMRASTSASLMPWCRKRRSLASPRGMADLPRGRSDAGRSAVAVALLRSRFALPGAVGGVASAGGCANGTTETVAGSAWKSRNSRPLGQGLSW